MNERENEATPAGSIDARLDVILREIVGGDGAADMRPRVMAAIAKARHGEQRVGTLPWRWIAVAGSLAAVVAFLIGPSHAPGPGAGTARSAAEATKEPLQVRPSEVAHASAKATMAASLRATALRAPAATDPETKPPLVEENSVPPLEIAPIEGTSPLVLPPIRTSSLPASEITIPAIDIEVLTVVPPSSGSF